MAFNVCPAFLCPGVSFQSIYQLPGSLVQLEYKAMHGKQFKIFGDTYRSLLVPTLWQDHNQAILRHTQV